jgi:hypothetical protein
MTENEIILLALLKLKRKEMAILIEQHIQQNGFLSDEAGKELRKILMGEQGHGKD